MQFKTQYDQMLQALLPLYGKAEGEAILRELFEASGDVQLINLKLENPELHPEQITLLQAQLSRLLQHEPVQYILGYAWFMGMPFQVNKQVLIPRPETEELCRYILNQFKNHPDKSTLHFVDLGCGSGCIPVALAKNLPGIHQLAVDISPDALEITRRNSEAQQVKIETLQLDMLDPEATLPGLFDCIVSNPPYIGLVEKTTMEPHVLAFEPHLALFYHNGDPLQFYRRIVALALQHLRPDGLLAMEINQLHGDAVIHLLQENQFHDVELHHDMHHNPRFVTARK